MWYDRRRRMGKEGKERGEKMEEDGKRKETSPPHPPFGHPLSITG
jgi:hypothetical protein